MFVKKTCIWLLTNSCWRSCECDSSSSLCLPRERLNLHTKLPQYSIRGEARGLRIKSINSLPLEQTLLRASFQIHPVFSAGYFMLLFVNQYRSSIPFCNEKQIHQFHLNSDNSDFRQKKWRWSGLATPFSVLVSKVQKAVGRQSI